ncbi:anthranilate synthase component I, partial [Staphylococcus saprophyticus]
AFPVLKKYPIEGEGCDALFHMVESVYVFAHYKEQIYVIATNLFSNATESELESRLYAMMLEFDQLQLFENEESSALPQKHIETNVSDADFIQRVKMFKQLIQQGDMFQVVPSRVYRYKHYFNKGLNT